MVFWSQGGSQAPLGTYCVQAFIKIMKITMESQGINAERWSLLLLFLSDRGVRVAQTGHGRPGEV